jgi:hypothetical protein
VSRYVYAEVEGARLDTERVAFAERVLEEARYQLDLSRGPHVIRWYVRSDRAADYALTKHGRVLDVPDARHLSGWYLDPAWIAVRADRPRRDIALTIGHETYHAWQEAHGQPLDEDRAERFAHRLLAHLEGEAA